MAIKSLQHSSLTDNIFYRSMLVGNTAFEPSDEDILAEQILSTSAASVTFSGLDTYAAQGYQHLQIRMVVKFDSSENSQRLRIRVNNEAIAEPRHFLGGNGSSVFSASGTTGADSTVITDRIADASSASAIFSPVIMDILDPFETTKNTTFRIFTGNPSTLDVQVSLQSFLYTDTQAINTLAFSGGNTNWAQRNFVTGSRFTLIGLK